MKAIITTAYGTTDVLKYGETEKPKIKKNEILVAVKYTCVNPVDWKIRKGEMKIMTGKTPPKILGTDYSGVIEKVGAEIKNYKKGDEVFGLVKYIGRKDGTYAEFLRVTEKEICLKPKNMGFDHAASLPMVAVTAYKALVEVAKLKSGQNVYISGCTGGVGGAAVQIAKANNCTVTGVCSTKNVEFAKSLGTDKVIDYKKDDLFKDKSKYDIVFDASGTLPYSQSKSLLKSGGTYVTTNGAISSLIFGPVKNIFRSKKSKIVMAAPSKEVMNTIKDLAEAGKIKAQIAKEFPHEKTKEAHEISQKGGFTGKLVLKV